MNLRVNCIDLNQGIITVKNQNGYKTKGKSERIIPISQNISEILVKSISGKSENDFLFEKVPGIKFNGNYVSKSFKKAVRLSGVNPSLKCHSLRHSFASSLAQNNISPLVIKELLGHSKIETSLIYSHTKRENLFQAVNSINRKPKKVSPVNFTKMFSGIIYN